MVLYLTACADTKKDIIPELNTDSLVSGRCIAKSIKIVDM